MSDYLLAVSGLRKAYGGRPALESVSFQVRRGQTVGLLGPNGAGKSTTVSIIAGLLRADAGTVSLGGQPLREGDNAAKRQLGLVPQDLALYEDLSARQNLMLFGALYGMSKSERQRRANEVLELVKLADRANDKPSTFSGGMKRRLNIAAALMHDPQLLILDEPTVGVDPQSRNAIFDTLEDLKRAGRSLIYTSHYMEEVERLADHIVIIDHGKVLADASPAALFQQLPAQAALQIGLGAPATESVLSALRSQSGVRQVQVDGDGLHVALQQQDQALPVLRWLQDQGVAIQHFATAKTKLEDIFLNLTGRSLRD